MLRFNLILTYNIWRKVEVSIYFSVSFEVTYKLREKGKSKKVFSAQVMAET